MGNQLQLRLREWITFAVLLAVLCVMLTFLPIPQGGQSEVIREQLYLLPIVTQPLDTPTQEPEETAEIAETTTAAEEILSNEQIAALLVEAFGIREDARTTTEQLEVASRSPNGLEVEEFDLGFLESEGERNQLVNRQDPTSNLQSNATSTQRLLPRLIQPGAGDGGDMGGGDSPRALESARSVHVATELQVRAETRPPPVTAENFQEAAFDDSLAAWIRNNPADLDPVILSVMGPDDDVATARAFGRTVDSTYELQMMLALANGEVRIVLIEGEDLYFFVRPPVRRAASYFQLGSARRNAAKVVVAVESEDFSPESDEAQAFYGLFLDWWRTQRK